MQHCWFRSIHHRLDINWFDPFLHRSFICVASVVVVYDLSWVSRFALRECLSTSPKVVVFALYGSRSPRNAKKTSLRSSSSSSSSCTCPARRYPHCLFAGRSLRSSQPAAPCPYVGPFSAKTFLARYSSTIMVPSITQLCWGIGWTMPDEILLIKCLK